MRRAGVLFVALAVLGSALLAIPSAADDAQADKAGKKVVPPALDDVEHMCALLTGCDRLPLPSGLVPRDFVSCVRGAFEELASGKAVTYSLTLRECGLKASSCGELRSCALRGAKQETCAGRGKSGAVDVCDGDGRAITCENERIAMVRDCPRGGEQCVVREGHAFCALGPCASDGAPSCSASGTRILECKKGKLVSLDCAAFGLRCVQGADGPACATQGAPCADGALRCEGSSAVACFHGREVKVDCAAAGLSCAGVGAGATTGASVGACTIAAGGSCDPSSAPRCDGATLKWCAWGSPRSYPCKSMGLSRCVTDEKGARCAG